MKALLVGSTGLIGRQLLRSLDLAPPSLQLLCFNRRELPSLGPRVVHQQLELSDSAGLSAAMEGWSGPKVSAQAPVQLAICCLGSTLKKAGSQAEFHRIDHDLVLSFAQACKKQGVPHFVYVSSLGAAPRSRSYYLRTKGEVEAALQALEFPQLSLLRPSMLDDEGQREEFRWAERLTLPIARGVLGLLAPKSRVAPIKSSSVAAAIWSLAASQSGPVEGTPQLRILESEHIRDLAAEGGGR